jgi:hypothetical protein
LTLENSSRKPEQFLIRRRECDSSAIKEILSGANAVAWQSANNYINFEIKLDPGQSKTIRIRFQELAQNGYPEANTLYRVKTMFRRYLSELRDNYFMKDDMRFRP